MELLRNSFFKTFGERQFYQAGLIRPEPNVGLGLRPFPFAAWKNVASKYPISAADEIS